MRLKGKISEHAKNTPEAEEIRRTFVSDTSQNHENRLFSS